MRPGSGITFCCLLIGLGWGIHALWSESQSRGAAREANADRRARIEEIRATPAYASLLQRGGEFCPHQPDRVIWICGATLRLPVHEYPEPARRLCSSPEAPEFVGSFPLPPAETAETPGASEGTLPESYSNTWVGAFSVGADGRLTPCEAASGSCRTLVLSGSPNLPTGFAQHPIPETLQAEPPPPEKVFYGHGLAIDAYLDLDGRRVAYLASGLRPETASCLFHALHPTKGFLVRYTMPCAERASWRSELRAVFADLDRRTVTFVEASCQVPPLTARIRRASSAWNVDANRAMRDWAVARDR